MSPHQLNAYVTDPGSTATYDLSIFQQPAADSFDVSLPASISSGSPSAGAGDLETTASEDDYDFTTSVAGRLELGFSNCTDKINVSLIDTSTGDQVWSQNSINSQVHASALPAGSYRLEVTDPGNTARYDLSIASDVGPATKAAYTTSVEGSSGLVAFYALSSDYSDEVTGGPTLTDHNTGFESDVAPWSDGGSLLFDGNSYAQLSSDPLSSASAFTFEAWVQWNGGNAWQRIFDFGSGESTFMMLTANNGPTGTLQFDMCSDGGCDEAVGSQPAPGSWSLIAVTEDSSGNMKIFVNGQSTGSGTTSRSPDSLGDLSNMYLGKSQWPDPDLNGSEAGVAIYDQALSAGTLADQYSAATS